jgi:hypothetical protein
MQIRLIVLHAELQQHGRRAAFVLRSTSSAGAVVPHHGTTSCCVTFHPPHLQAKSGNSRKKSGAAAAGARQQLSGFEGCEPMFGHADIYPKYQAGKCQAWHSGEVQEQQLH